MTGIPRTGTSIFVAVGSNIAPESSILKALAALRQRVSVLATSAFYQSEPKGRRCQAPFYNGVWRIETPLPPEQVKFGVLREVEATLGRRRTGDKDAPRPIDLDLILYDDRVVSTRELRLPDPDIYRYGFIAVPLAELAPDLVLPDRGVRVADLDSANKKGELRLLEAFSSQLKGRLTE